MKLPRFSVLTLLTGTALVAASVALMMGAKPLEAFAD